MNDQAMPLERGTAEHYAAWFRALADPTRVQIVSLLARSGGQHAALSAGLSTTRDFDIHLY